MQSTRLVPDQFLTTQLFDIVENCVSLFVHSQRTLRRFFASELVISLWAENLNLKPRLTIYRTTTHLVAVLVFIFAISPIAARHVIFITCLLLSAYVIPLCSTGACWSNRYMKPLIFFRVPHVLSETSNLPPNRLI